METDPFRYVAIRRERYAQWEKASPITCLTLAVAAVASAVTLQPSLLAAAGSFLAGVAIFLSWRAALRERFNATLLFSLLGIVLSFSELVFDVDAPVMIQFARGGPWVGLGLFLGIYVSRQRGVR